MSSPETTPSIADSHIDHETALGMAKSIRRAEVALLGDDTDGIAPWIEQELAQAHATLVRQPTAMTRYVIPTSTATEDEILAASDRGALLIKPEDVSSLVRAYLAVWFPDSLKEAARRAREEARRLALMRAFTVKVNAEKWRDELVGARMARSSKRIGGPGDADEAPLAGSVDRDAVRERHLSADERRVEDHARRTRW